MGTGVGEAMLIGAITGAGTSAVTGGDPLKGAMFGAMGGAVMPGIGQALGGAEAASASTLASTGASTVAPGAAGNVGMGMSGFGNTIGTAAAPTTTGTLGGFGQVGAGGFGNAALPGAADIAGSGASVMPAGASSMVPSTVTAPAATSGNLPNLPSTGDLLNRDNQKATSALANLINKYPIGAPAAGGAFTSLMLNRPDGLEEEDKYKGPLSMFRYDPRYYRPAYASGGITDSGIAGTERGMYPQSQFDKTQYAVPSQMPTSAEVIASGYEPRVNPYTGETKYASGGIADLGSYSDGGRLLKGPGDGMSDSIPARIGARQPARLGDGEFVVPADVVSHLGNGSTDAGAKQLYAMMDKVRRARTGTKKQGREINPRKLMPA